MAGSKRIVSYLTSLGFSPELKHNKKDKSTYDQYDSDPLSTISSNSVTNNKNSSQNTTANSNSSNNSNSNPFQKSFYGRPIEQINLYSEKPNNKDEVCIVSHDGERQVQQSVQLVDSDSTEEEEEEEEEKEKEKEEEEGEGKQNENIKHESPKQPLTQPLDNYEASLKYLQENEEDSEVTDLLLSYEEEPKHYKIGGYHPAYVGEVMGRENNYKLLRKLGWGHFSTVWLAYDNLAERHVAVKISKSGKSYTAAAREEINLFKTINQGDPNHPGYSRIIQMLDWFEHTGENGTHICQVFEVLGESVLSLIKKFRRANETNLKTPEPPNDIQSISDNDILDEEDPVNGRSHQYINLSEFSKCYGGLPIQMAKEIIKQVLVALDYLHRECGIIHTDIKPENLMVEIKDMESFVSFVTDYERKRERSYFKFRRPSTVSLVTNPEDDQIRNNSIISIGNPVNKSKPLPSPLFTKFEVDEEKGDIFDGYSLIFNDKRVPNIKQGFEEIISVKLADFGNACRVDERYSDYIQTREYRAPEIVLGFEKWGSSVDIWSAACLFYELITGDYMFKPRVSNKSRSRTDCHIALFIERLGPFSPDYLECCRYSRNYYCSLSKGMLKNVPKLYPIDLRVVLTNIYSLEERVAQEFYDFLIPMLQYDPEKRADAGGCTNSPFLEGCYSVASIRDRKYGSCGKDIKGWAEYFGQKPVQKPNSAPVSCMKEKGRTEKDREVEGKKERKKGLEGVACS